MVLCAAALAASPGEPHRATPESERLPDLDQEVPWGLQVTHAGPRAAPEYRLGFRSAVRNIGDGPLVVHGQRERIADPTMTANQLIERQGAPHAVIEGVGELRYVRSPDHEHWHLLGFERYQLRRAGRRAALLSDRKTGFCLGDRYRVTGRDFAARPAAPRYTGRCGLGRKARLHLLQGISVGYGDDYPANLEGQSLRLTGLAAGRYVLVHRVNVGRRLRETVYGNNAAALLLDIRWQDGAPRVRVLRSCPDNARCD
jgi:hypothetical protein